MELCPESLPESSKIPLTTLLTEVLLAPGLDDEGTTPPWTWWRPEDRAEEELFDTMDDLGVMLTEPEEEEELSAAMAVVSEPEEDEEEQLDSSVMGLSILDGPDEALAEGCFEEEEELEAIMSELEVEDVVVAIFSFRISSLTTGK